MPSAVTYILFGHTIIFNAVPNNTLQTAITSTQVPSIDHSLDLSTPPPNHKTTETVPDITSIAPHSTEPPSIDQTTPESDCETRRTDYTYVPGFGCYKFHTQALNWPEARIMCQDEGGYLAVINSVAEADVIVKIFENAGPIAGSSFTEYASIGYHDLDREGDFVTIHGESLQHAGYDKWEPRAPDGGRSQNCGSLRKNGRLEDIGCNMPFGFICEIPAS